MPYSSISCHDDAGLFTGVFGNNSLLRQVTQTNIIDNTSTRGECMSGITIVDDTCAIYKGRGYSVDIRLTPLSVYVYIFLGR